jgi:hypothetical protein
MNGHDMTQSARPRATVFPIAGATISGAAMGCAVAGIWHETWQVSRTACGETSDCLSPAIILAPAAVRVSVLLVVAVSTASFAALRIRPLVLSVTAMTVLSALAVVVLVKIRHDGSPPTVWLLCVMLAAAAALAAGIASAAEPHHEAGHDPAGRV